MGKEAALSVTSSLLYIQTEAKFIKAQPSLAKPGPNFAKEKAWISFDFLGDYALDSVKCIIAISLSGMSLFNRLS
jgi:hypothetical protein